jgi:hypothetical protein
MAVIAGQEVIRSHRVGAFQKYVVVRVEVAAKRYDGLTG